MTELLFQEETYSIRGACFEVYKDKGCGFLEAVYQECLEIEFQLSDIPVVSQQKLDLNHKGRNLKVTYLPDFVCFEKIIVEIKAVSNLTDEHRAQIHNYLKATGFRVGLLVNFGHHPGVQIERVIR